MIKMENWLISIHNYHVSVMVIMGCYLCSWGGHVDSPDWGWCRSRCTLIWRERRWGILYEMDPGWRLCLRKRCVRSKEVHRRGFTLCRFLACRQKTKSQKTMASNGHTLNLCQTHWMGFHLTVFMFPFSALLLSWHVCLLLKNNYRSCKFNGKIKKTCQTKGGFGSLGFPKVIKF